MWVLQYCEYVNVALGGLVVREGLGDLLGLEGHLSLEAPDWQTCQEDQDGPLDHSFLVYPAHLRDGKHGKSTLDVRDTVVANKPLVEWTKPT